MDPQRRSFLRGRLRERNHAILPPWIRNARDFHEDCTRCDRCIQACPGGIVVRDGKHAPHLDFRLGECTFCTRCATSCPENLFENDFSQPPWDYIARFDGGRCLPFQGVTCQSCQDACEGRAIRFPPRIGGAARPTLESSRCTGCGACVAICPVNAVAMVRDDTQHGELNAG